MLAINCMVSDFFTAPVSKTCDNVAYQCQVNFSFKKCNKSYKRKIKPYAMKAYASFSFK